MARIRMNRISGTTVDEFIDYDVLEEQGLKDNRKLVKWFTDGIDGKSIVFSGDSTTWAFQNTFGNALERVFRDGRVGRAQIKYPLFRDVLVYARGENGGTLSSFINNQYTNNHRNDPTTDFYSVDTPGNLSDLIAMQADVYVLSWGINDCRTGTAYTAGTLQADLTTAVNALRAGVPKACIILRMPNAHATDNIGAYMTGGATAQNMMDRYKTAYRALKNTWDDVLVWDSMSGLYPNVAPAAATNCLLISTDSLHPSTSAYDQILDAIFWLLTPATNYRDDDWANEGTRSNPFKHNTTNNLLRWDPSIDPRVLEGPDWYKVYRIASGSDAARASYCRLSFLDYARENGTAAAIAARNNAWTTGVAAPGIVPGDVISLNGSAGQAYTFVVNQLPAFQSSGSAMQWGPHPAGTWSAAETEDLIAGHPITVGIAYGFVYRHKYAHCESMRQLVALLANPMKYDEAVSTTNPYAVQRRFYVQATPALGAFTAQTIGSETGGDLSAFAWDTTHVVCIPGVTTGPRTGGERVNSLILPLTGAIFTPDGPNKRMAITGVTSGGVLVDFSKHVIPQGYVLSAT